MNRLGEQEAYALVTRRSDELQAGAAAVRDAGFGAIITYSRKVFIPLTLLCRDSCAYCTFAKTPAQAGSPYLDRDAVLHIAREGRAAGCQEALFTLGDKPEERYAVARQWLDRRGFATTAAYVAAMAELVLNETGLLPHINAGVLGAAEMSDLRRVSASQGLMLESTAERLCAPGGPHHGCPDKRPARRLDMIRAAGELNIPFTTGLLVGIGETRRERIDTLLAIRDLHATFGHIQEVIVQNFRAKPATRMARAAEPDLEEILWTVCVARLVLDPQVSIQVPPNLNANALALMIAAGIDDWGGVSPVTPDHVNPEAAWPAIADLARQTAAAGKVLVPRLTIYPRHARDGARWLDPGLQGRVLDCIDAEGFARLDPWSPGAPTAFEPIVTGPHRRTACGDHGVDHVLRRARDGEELAEADVTRLFAAREDELHAVCAAADELRRQTNGDAVSYVVTRNINYTNICSYRCKFCAFSKGKTAEHLRGHPYVLDLEEIARRAREAWERGATEVCLQGGIHPDYTGRSYLDICRAIRAAVPDMHIHAFSALEVWHGASTLDEPLSRFLGRLRDAGLGSLPGTAAEILDDEIRRIICPDKVTTDQWFAVIEAAHAAGLKTTATIMFGHVEQPVHWARHLLRLRRLQQRTGGFTELVPLPFVPMEAPIYLRGQSRRGPTRREALLMHAVSRLVLHPYFRNVQTSWPKMGRSGAAACLEAGCNDLGGTLMNESISRAAGAGHGQELPPRDMDRLIRTLGRTPRQRTTLYADAPPERVRASYGAAPLVAV